MIAQTAFARHKTIKDGIVFQVWLYKGREGAVEI